MNHYFLYLRITCRTFNDCSGCKYIDKHKKHNNRFCLLKQVLNSNNDYFFGNPTTWTIQDFNRIDKNKMVFLEGI